LNVVDPSGDGHLIDDWVDLNHELNVY
jgi:hypothetical protein